MKIAVLSLALVCLFACTPKSKTQKQYPLTGKVVSIDAKEHTANIDAAAIPNFMGAMTMDYPIASESELAALKPGETITATVNVNADGSYNLSNIRPGSAPPAGK